MAKEEEIANGFKILSGQAGISDFKVVTIKIGEGGEKFGELMGYLFPSVEGDIVSVEISPPIITTIPPTPKPTVTLDIGDPDGRSAVFFGISAGVHLHGSTWKEASPSLSYGWESLQAGHGIDWETAKPHVVRGWNAVDYILKA